MTDRSEHKGGQSHSLETKITTVAADEGGVSDAATVNVDLLRPPGPRSLECLLYNVYLTWSLVVCPVMVCAAHSSYYAHFFHAEKSIIKASSVVTFFFDAAGYDFKQDHQWRAYLRGLGKLVPLYIGMSVATYILRCSMKTGRREGRSNGVRDEPRTQSGGSGINSESEKSFVPWSRSQASLIRCVHWIQRTILGKWWALGAFYAALGTVVVLVMHGPQVVILFFILLMNYVIFSQLSKRVSFKLFSEILWTTHIALLYITYATQGFAEYYWVQYFFPSHPLEATRVLNVAARPLWRRKMRWSIAYRMSTLRMIAFNFDLWEARHNAAAAREALFHKHAYTCVECAQLRASSGGGKEEVDGVTPAADGREHHDDDVESVWCYKLRAAYPRDLKDYNVVNYVAYLLFTPLYLAGPMMTYNAFVSYLRTPSRTMSAAAMLKYGLRVVFIGVCNTVLLHTVFVHAFSRNLHLTLQFPISHQAYFMFLFLGFLWLKYSFLWKSARLFALWCGIEAPEDMRRCFVNTYTVRDFWRDWHASFNLWIVRYMYVPMGGSRNILLSIGPIFVFIAIWHDPALHLFKWALSIVSMFALELFVSGTFGRVVSIVKAEMMAVGRGREEGLSPADGRRRSGVTRAVAKVLAIRLTDRQREVGYRVLRTMGGTFTVLWLIIANLVGFNVQKVTASSTDKSKTDQTIIDAIVSGGPLFVALVLLSMYCAAAMGVIHRDREAFQQQQLRREFGLLARPPRRFTPSPTRVEVREGTV